MSTGDEIFDVQSGEAEQEGSMWDTNRPSLSAVLQGLGYDIMDLGIIPDRSVFGFPFALWTEDNQRLVAFKHTYQRSPTVYTAPISSSRQEALPWDPLTYSSLSSSGTS